MGKRRRRNREKQNDETQPKYQRISLCDPHLLQSRHISVKESLESLYMDYDSYPRSVYYSRENELKSTLHWGQRKLFLSEMHVLTAYLKRFPVKEEHLVLYAGAAPGTHINYLSALFPMFKFILVDPADFKVFNPDSTTTDNTSRITIKKEYFTDELAMKYKNCVDLFFCDIRTANWRIMSFDQNEECVKNDMLAQRKWTQIIQPKVAMLKFRLPYTDGQIEYFSGNFLLPIFAPQTTTETRLIVMSEEYKEMKVYDHRTYWEQLFHFNTVDRVCYYHHEVDCVDGMDHCFDCASEVYILNDYLRFMYNLDEAEIPTKIGNLSDRISQEISTSGRKLSDFPSHTSSIFQPIVHRQDVSTFDE